MPNKTIYVSDDDLPILQRAQELAGASLSAVIMRALKRYVDTQEAVDEGFEEITVKVGRGKGRQQRFIGTLLGEWGTWDSSKAEMFRVYRSRKGKYVVHTERTTDAISKTQGWRSHLGLAPGAWGIRPAEATLQIVDTVDEVRDLVPVELYEMVADSPESSGVEDLDI